MLAFRKQNVNFCWYRKEISIPPQEQFTKDIQMEKNWRKRSNHGYFVSMHAKDF